MQSLPLLVYIQYYAEILQVRLTSMLQLLAENLSGVLGNDYAEQLNDQGLVQMTWHFQLTLTEMREGSHLRLH